MERKEFYEKVAKAVEEALQQEVMIHTIKKDGCSYEGLAAKQNLSAIANLDKLYDAFGEKLLNKMVEEIVDILTTPVPFNPEIITDYDLIKDKLFIDVIPFEQRRSAVGRKFKDMYLEVRVMVDSTDGLATCVVLPELAETWEVSEEEIFEIAFENTPSVLPIVIDDLGAFAHTKLGVYVVTNQFHARGAVSIFMPEAQEQIKSYLGEEVLCVPVSKNEMICLKYESKKDEEKAKEMLKAFNAVAQDEEDFLSNNVYNLKEITSFLA